MSIIADGFFLLSRSLDYSFIDLNYGKSRTRSIYYLSKYLYETERLTYIDPFIRTIILSAKCIGIEQCSFLYVLPQQQGAESHEEKKTTQFGKSEGSSQSNAAANPSQLLRTTL